MRSRVVMSERAVRAVSEGRILRFLTFTILLLALGSGVLMSVIDSKDFPTLGDGIWWAVVTFSTVGYGDLVPTTAVGKLVASGVMLSGITFISFLTAVVTSAYMDRARALRDTAEQAVEQQILAALERVEQRLEALERRAG